MQKVKIDDTWYDVPDEVVKRMGEYYSTMVRAIKEKDDLVAKAFKVRDAQKLYFKHPKAYNLLDEAKAAEKELDDLLSGKTKVIVEQKALF